MKRLQEIINGIQVLELRGNPETVISGLTLDSRSAGSGMLFAAVRGTQTDGHRFIPQVILAGVAAVLCEEIPADANPDVAFIRVGSVAQAIGHMASAFFDHPTHQLKVVGVTGTNGKTTIASLLWRLAENLGYPSGLLSTISVRIHDVSSDATHTTPDAITIQKNMAAMAEAGCTFAFMEVSSHALDQGRVNGIRFTGGIFTNLTRDHLDYHHDFQSYLKAKKLFFDQLPREAFALTNSEDRNGSVMVQNCSARKYTYSTKGPADFAVRLAEQHLDGMQLLINGREFWTRFVGRFNASNLAAVYSAAILLDFREEEVLRQISLLTPVEGRLETIPIGNNCVGIVDYAHTPDALENVLKTLQELRAKGARIITVFGAGGDRDRGKRPLMAEVACRYSDQVIITSDNPRTEDPDQIIGEILTGVPAGKARSVISITNRHEAIKTAVALAREGDIILVAGKGHETYQEINGVKHHFDDREELKGLTTDDGRPTKGNNRQPVTGNRQPDNQ
ncbi:MAG: UDP-N-acetylmuramoyl-L-alanyl-D-glutamate--2,6-diaminopimelate ligase [Bacteroidetes bacterium GWF2_49_14]|nr:MAG: UDP-N-acetylmuramoyl-L-alanyl-D-glutamate--2,6-diaminopimelate ligase [Bacteroidetes bacterium GWF2_49_14]